MQAWEQGIKVQPATYDSDSEEETWDDAMADLEDPWMREPPGVQPASHVAQQHDWACLSRKSEGGSRHAARLLLIQL